MYKFGTKSKSRLDTCHKDLQTIMNEVIKVYDCSIIEGHRTLETQQEYFKNGKSQLDGINKKSKHQSSPSMAIDVMPYYKGFNPFTDENGKEAFYYQAGLIMGIAARLKENGKIYHNLRWGGNWDSDMDFFNDSNFFDLPHFELI